MMWKRILLSVLGAGILGAAVSESSASALDCPATCGYCYCADFVSIVSTTWWHTVSGTDGGGASSTVRARRQAISGGTAAKRRSIDYEVLSIGSTHHTGFAQIACTNSSNGDGWSQWVDDLGAGQGAPLSCPVGMNLNGAWVGITMTNDVCPASNWRCVP